MTKKTKATKETTLHAPIPPPRDTVYNPVYMALGFVAILAAATPWLANQYGALVAAVPLLIAGIIFFLAGVKRRPSED